MELIDELKRESFRNAIRLFRDACLLVQHGRNTTAFAVAVLAYEEIGKSALADRQLDRVCLNPSAEEYARRDMKMLLKNHDRKQVQAAFDSDAPDYNVAVSYDQRKQRVLYVGYDGKKVTIPNVSDEEVCAILTEVYRALKSIGDLPYYGVAGVSSKKSEWLATRDIEMIKKEYEQAIQKLGSEHSFL